MTTFEILKDKFLEIFCECPFCEGMGGEKDIILDDGSGPWYPCHVCNKSGYMNPFKKLYWKTKIVFWEWDNNRQMKKGVNNE